MTTPLTTPPLRRASYTLHVVNVVNHDREGDQPFPVARLQLVRLLDQVLDLFETEPRFHHFTLDQAILLEDYLALRPENFERIEQAVQDGRLLVGPWYIQTEPLLVGQEALIRNLMIGLRTAHVFGLPLRVGYLPDVIGLPGQLPQILKGFGIETAITGPFADDLPTEVRWQGDDGTEILVGYLRHTSADERTRSIQDRRNAIAPYTESGHLLLPIAFDVEVVRSLPTIQRELHDNIFHSSPVAYAKSIETQTPKDKLPILHGQLGGDTKPTIYERDRAVERLLTEQIEPYAAWASFTENVPNYFERPHTLIQKLWRTLLENQSQAILRDNADSDLKVDVERRFRYIERMGAALSADLPILRTLITSSTPEFQISAVKLPEESDRSGIIVRGENLDGEPHWVTLTPWRAFATADVVSLDEAPTGGKLAPDPDTGGTIRFLAGPRRILSFWLHD